MRNPVTPFRAAALAAVVLLGACESATGSDSLVDRIGDCSNVRDITIPTTQSGTLSSGDCRLQDNTYVDFYAFRVTESRQVDIRHSSTAFDTYLLLFTANGTLIDEDDDSGDTGALDSRIVRTLSPGVYVVGANAYDEGETGAYTLRIN